MRYHVVSVAAVFLALAVGVVLGSTSVSDRLLAGVGRDRDSLSKQVDGLRAERGLLTSRLAAADRFSGAVAPLVVRDRLDQRSVVVITTPDASPRDRDALVRLLGSAGANVVGQLQLTEGFVDPDRADQLRQLVTRVLPAGVRLPVVSDPGAVAGALLGSLALVDPRTGQQQASPAERAAAMDGLTDGGFVAGAQNIQPAQLAVVLTGGPSPNAMAADRAAVIVRFAGALSRMSAGTVLAGRGGSADGNGSVGLARSDPAIASMLSTVDNVDASAGRVATVLALRERWEKQVGHYGSAASAQGPLPNQRS